MRRDTKVTLAILAFIVLIAGLFTVFTRMNIEPEAVPVHESVQRATDGSYTDLTGQPIVLEPSAHTLTVVVSWASWCPSCTEELEKAIALADSYASSGVQVIALNRAEPAFRIEQYLQSINLGLEDSAVSLVLDPADHLFASVEGYTVPETIIVTPEETILSHVHGPMNEAVVREVIEEVLNQ
jgi:thiol-disulfide isomerase/thioredoxin